MEFRFLRVWTKYEFYGGNMNLRLWIEAPTAVAAIYQINLKTHTNISGAIRKIMDVRDRRCGAALLFFYRLQFFVKFTNTYTAHNEDFTRYVYMIKFENI